MSRFSKRLYLVNFFGTLFYLSCLLQWAWAVLPYMPGIVRFVEILQPKADAPAEPVQAVAYTPPSTALIVTGIIMTALVIAATIYALIKLPTAVAKSGQKITQSASEKIVPVVTHRAKLTPKKQRQLSARIVIYLKLATCLAPIILSACAYFLKTELGYGIIMIVTAVLGIGTLLLLAAQLLLAKWLKVKSEAVW